MVDHKALTLQKINALHLRFCHLLGEAHEEWESQGLAGEELIAATLTISVLLSSSSLTWAAALTHQPMAFLESTVPDFAQRVTERAIDGLYETSVDLRWPSATRQ